MTERLRWPVLGCVLVMLVSIGAAGSASGQTPDTPSAPSSPPVTATARVPIGGRVTVTDTRGAAIRGTLVAVAEEGVRVNVSGTVLELAAGDVQGVQWHQADSRLDGLLIGAGVGALPGIYWLIADPNECTGLCPEDYAMIGIGAAIGALIDGLVMKKVTVYEASGPARRPARLMIAPILTGTRRGVQAGVTF